MAFSIRLTDEQKRLAESCARLRGISMGEAFKQTLFDKIEEEFDIAIGEAAHREWVESGKKSRPWSELKKELFGSRRHLGLIRSSKNLIRTRRG